MSLNSVMDSFSGIILDIGERTFRIYLGILVGFIFIKSPLGKYRKEFVQLAINVFTPFLVFISILRLELSDTAFIPIIVSIFVTGIGIGLPWIMNNIIFNKEPNPAETCTAAFPNALNFPFPLIFAYSPDYLGIAGIFLVVQIVLRNTIGLYISGIRLSRKYLLEILFFIPLWGVILGLLLRGVNVQISSNILYSNWIETPFQIGIFVSLMTLGFSMKLPSFEYKESYLSVGLSRFVVSPLMLGIIAFIIPVPTAVMIPLIIQSAAPPAVYNGLYAERFNLDTDLTTNVTVVLTLIALIFLPFEIFLIDILFF